MEKHWASLHYEPEQPQIEQNPAPPPLGGGVCWSSIGKICQHTGMSANTVAKYIRQLENKQLINVELTKVRTNRGEVRNGTF